MWGGGAPWSANLGGLLDPRQGCLAYPRGSGVVRTVPPPTMDVHGCHPTAGSVVTGRYVLHFESSRLLPPPSSPPSSLYICTLYIYRDKATYLEPSSVLSITSPTCLFPLHLSRPTTPASPSPKTLADSPCVLSHLQPPTSTFPRASAAALTSAVTVPIEPNTLRCHPPLLDGIFSSPAGRPRGPILGFALSAPNPPS